MERIATFALSNGENVKVISESFGHGHEESSTTQNIYSHTTETMLQETVTRIDSLMFKKTKKEISVEKAVESKLKGLR